MLSLSLSSANLRSSLVFTDGGAENLLTLDREILRLHSGRVPWIWKDGGPVLSYPLEGDGDWLRRRHSCLFQACLLGGLKPQMMANLVVVARGFSSLTLSETRGAGVFVDGKGCGGARAATFCDGGRDWMNPDWLGLSSASVEDRLAYDSVGASEGGVGGSGLLDSRAWFGYCISTPSGGEGVNGAGLGWSCLYGSTVTMVATCGLADGGEAGFQLGLCGIWALGDARASMFNWGFWARSWLMNSLWTAGVSGWAEIDWGFSNWLALMNEDGVEGDKSFSTPIVI